MRKNIAVIGAVILFAIVGLLISSGSVVLPDYWTQLAVALTLMAIGLLGWGFKPEIGGFIRRKAQTGEKEKPAELARTFAEEKQKLEEGHARWEAHRQHLLSIYNKWASSYASHSQQYTYGHIKLGVYIANLPHQENYYPEARADLECYMKTYELLRYAEQLIEEADSKGGLLVGKIEQKVKLMLHGLESNEDGQASGRWYDPYPIIKYLILKPISLGSKYRKPQFEWKQRVPKVTGKSGGSVSMPSRLGSIRSDEESAVYADELNSEEAKNVTQRLNSLPESVSKLSEDIKALQDDLKKAEAAYKDFINSLKEDVIKPLETGLPIPNGGKCRICLSLQV